MNARHLAISCTYACSRCWRRQGGKEVQLTGCESEQIFVLLLSDACPAPCTYVQREHRYSVVICLSDACADEDESSCAASLLARPGLKAAQLGLSSARPQVLAAALTPSTPLVQPLPPPPPHPHPGSIVSISLAFAAVGSLLAGWLADKLGRRAALQLMAVPLVAGSVMR